MLLEINIVGIILATSGSTILILVAVIGFFGKTLIINFRRSISDVNWEIKKLCISFTKLNSQIKFANQTIEQNNTYLINKADELEDNIKDHEKRITIIETKAN